MTDQKLLTGDLPKTEVFTATLKLRSVGNSQNIIPELTWSHQLDGNLEDRADRNQLPYSYMAMVKIANGIKAVMRPLDPMLEEALPEDQDEAAIMLDAVAEYNENGRKTN